VALGTGELAAGLLSASSPVVAVADLIVDNTPGALIRAGIEALGSSDKPALLVGIVAISLALGAALGPLAGRQPLAGVVALAAFGVLGASAVARDPLTDLPAALVIAMVAAGSGYVVLRLGLGAALSNVHDEVTVPGRGTGSRRRFLLFAGGAAGAASVAALAGRAFGPTVDVDEQRASVVLPEVVGGRATAGTGLAVAGISPLITPNADFYRIDTAFVVPRVDADTWRLNVTGMVDHPFEVTFADLLAMPAVEEAVTLTCVSNEVGGDLVGNAIWRGVLLTDLLTRAGVQSGASQIVGRSVDGFTTGFPTDVARDGRRAMVAYAMNGEPLPAEHGFPARLVVPGLYGYVSATKWLGEIELTTLEAFDAYWIPRGWAKLAPIKTQSRIDTPRNGRSVALGRVPVAGVAWGGIRSVSRVDVRITPEGSSGGAWHEATLGEALSTSTWRQWVLDDWDPAPGTYVLEVRATDGDGDEQTEAEQAPAPDGATGLHTISVSVRSS